MIKRLHWFVIKSFLGPFVMTFFISLFILLMQFLWKYIDDMVGKGLEWAIVAEFLMYATSGLVPLAIPLAMLLASIMTFGNLGENYELVAMKASGISLFRIMRPLLVLAVLITVFAFYFSNNVLPKTNLKFGALLVSIKEQKPEMVIQEGIFSNDIDGYSIKVERKGRNSNMLYDIMIYDHTDNQGNASVTVADSGFMRITEDKKFMTMNLYSGESYRDVAPNERGREKRYPFQREKFQHQVVNINLKDFDFKRRDESIFQNSYRMMNLSQLNQQGDSLYNDYRMRLRSFMVSMSYNPDIVRSVVNETHPHDSLRRDVTTHPDTIVDVTATFENLSRAHQEEAVQAAISAARQNSYTILQHNSDLYNRKKLVNKFAMEKHRKFTWSFACLIFFFIGAPLGAIIRKGGLGMPVVVSILMFIAYYMMSISGEKFAREDVWDMFRGMWFSSAIFLPMGIFLTYKAATDSAIMNLETYQLILKRIVSLRLLRKKEPET